MNDGHDRCDWEGKDDAMRRYHDEEWGVPVHDDRKWFEYLVLDLFQAGLSWKTVLHKREAFRKTFHDFDPVCVAAMTEEEIDAVLANPAIIRNRLKVRATVQNAAAFLALQRNYGSFDSFIWSFTDGKVVRNEWKTLQQIPASTPLSDRVSRSLRQQGFSFVGSTICYAMLQAGGVVNDHLQGCPRWAALAGGDQPAK